MPRKERKNTEFDISKKERLIRNRLMKISLKLQDFGYENKSIPQEEAELYIQEINTYKNECGNDKESLQVIQYLTRRLKALIAEQKKLSTLQDKKYNENNLQPDLQSAPSPVYSLPDEDRVQLTQQEVQINANSNDKYANNNPRLNHNAKFIDITQSTKDIQDYEATARDSNKRSEIIIFQNDIDNNGANDENNTTKHENLGIYRALSNLTITDTDLDNELMATDVGHSQSLLNDNDPLLQHTSSQPNILNNGINYNIIDVEIIKSKQTESKCNEFNSTSTIKFQNEDITSRSKIMHFDFCSINNNKSIVQQATNMTEITVFKDINTLENRTAIETNIITLPKTRLVSKLNSVANNTNFDTSDQSVIKSTSNTSTFKKLKRSINTVNTQNSNVPNSRKQKYFSANSITDLNYTDNTTNHKSRKRKTNPTDVNNLVKKTTKAGTKRKIDTGKSSIVIKKKREPRKKKLVENNVIKEANNTQKRLKVNKKKIEKNNPKYDLNNVIQGAVAAPMNIDNLEIDLSWLESIEFVREIEEHEYLHEHFVDENFWDNNDLPANFDLNDFL